MRVNNENYLSIWVDDNEQLKIINQLSLPHKFEVTILHNFEEVVASIKNMLVRGAGLIGVTAGYGMWLLTKEAPKNSPPPSFYQDCTPGSDAGCQSS